MLKKLGLPVLALGAALTFLGPSSALAQYLTPHQAHEQQERLRHLRHEQREHARRMSRGHYYTYRTYDPFSTNTVVYNWWGDPIGYYDWWGYFHPYGW